MSPGLLVPHLLFAARLLLGWSALAPGAMAGSSPREIKVDAIAHSALSTREFFSYEISRSAPRNNDRPWWADAVRHTRTALSGCGLYEAPPGVIPELTIEVDCGLTAPRVETRTRSAPMLDPRPDVQPFGTTPLAFVTDNYQIALRLKYLMVTARPRGSAVMLWRVQAALDDDSPDLETCLPLLAAAVMNHVGHDTRGIHTMRLSPRDTDVAFINRGMP